MIKRLSHVGLSVADIERSIEFYRAALGMELVSRSTFEPGRDDGNYEAILALPGATGKVCALKVCDVQLELFEFSCPSPKRADPDRPVCDHGISHFCLEVTDIEKEHDRLQAAGARFHCPPLTFRARAKATYCRDPDGNVIELWERIRAAPQSSGVENDRR